MHKHLTKFEEFTFPFRFMSGQACANDMPTGHPPQHQCWITLEWHAAGAASASNVRLST